MSMKFVRVVRQELIWMFGSSFHQKEKKISFKGAFDSTSSSLAIVRLFLEEELEGEEEEEVEVTDSKEGGYGSRDSGEEESEHEDEG